MPDLPVFTPRATTIPVLRYLVAVADLGHFGKAAHACSVSQPTLSAQIAQWERRMGVVVFERAGAGARVTPVGEAIVAEARQLLAGLERLEAATGRLQAPFFGAVRLGVIPTVGPYLLPLIGPALEQAFPDLELPLREDQTDPLLEALGVGRLDCAILAEVPGLAGGRVVVPLYQEPLFVALPRGHRLESQASISARDLAQERVLLLDEGHCLREQALELCQLRERDERGADWRATSLETLRQLVALRRGCTVLPALAAGEGAGTPTAGGAISLRPLADRKAMRSICLVWRASDPRGDAYRLLVPAIRAAMPRSQVRLR